MPRETRLDDPRAAKHVARVYYGFLVGPSAADLGFELVALRRALVEPLGVPPLHEVVARRRWSRL